MGTPTRRRLADLELIECIGVGGSAQVWCARRLGSTDRFAVKVFGVGPDGPGRDAMARELRASARIEHANVVPVLDVVEDRERVGLVMELCRGSLADWMRLHGPLPPWWVAEVGVQVLAGLQAAHRAGIVHRDVKPANVLVAFDGRIAVSDFGIAQLRDRSGEHTMTSEMWGTLPFTAPERRHGGPLDATVDLYGLAATLAFAALGDVAGDLFVPQVGARVSKALPPMLADVLLRAGAYAPSERWADASAMSTALLGIRNELVGRDAIDLRELGPRRHLEVHVASGRRRRGSAGTIAFAGASGVLLSGAVALAIGMTSTPPSPADLVRCDDSPGSLSHVKRLGPRETVDAVVADLDADGRSDVVFTNQLDESLWIYWGSDIPLGQHSEIRVRRSGSRPAIGDVDGDGRLDLIVSHVDHGALSVLTGGVGRTFSVAKELFQAPSVSAIALMDWDDDGVLDLLMQLVAEERCTAWRRGEGGGEFAPYVCIGPAADSIDPYGEHPRALYRRDDGWLVRHRATPSGLLGASERVVSLDELDVGSGKTLAIRDNDGDGIDELYLSALGGRVPRLLRVGPSGEGCVLWEQPSYDETTLADVADVDGDGLLDAVVRATCEGCESNHSLLLGVAR